MFENLAAGLTFYAVCQHFFLKFHAWAEIWHLRVTHLFYLKKSWHDYFFAQFTFTRLNFVQMIFLWFEKKHWGHSGTFGDMLGQISDIAKSRLNIPQNEALDVIFPRKLVLRSKKSSMVNNCENGFKRANFNLFQNKTNYFILIILYKILWQLKEIFWCCWFQDHLNLSFKFFFDAV